MKTTLTLLFVLLITACQERIADAPVYQDPALVNNYWPLQVGNFWIYEYYQFSADDKIIGSSVRQDSLVVVAERSKNGLSGFELINFTGGDFKNDTIIVISQNDSLYLFADEYYNSVYDYDVGWIKIFDIRDLNWLTVSKDNFFNTIKIEDKTYDTYSDIRLYSSYGGTDKYLKGDLQLKTYYISETYDVKSEISDAYQIEDQPVDLEVYNRRISVRYFADSVGLALNVIRPSIDIIRHFDDGIMFKEEVDSLPGTVSRLLRYKIAE